jgi:predicted transposase/invertase (TIGR01784 family)
MRLVLDIHNDLRYQEGREEGIYEEAKRVAEFLLKDGFEVEYIAGITGFTIEQLIEIKNSLSEEK